MLILAWLTFGRLLTVLLIAHRLARHFIKIFIHLVAQLSHKLFEFFIRSTAFKRVFQSALRSTQLFERVVQIALFQPQSCIPQQFQNFCPFFEKAFLIDRIGQSLFRR